MTEQEIIIEEAQKRLVRNFMFKDKDIIETICRSDIYAWLDKYEEIKEEIRKERECSSVG